jgi:hypothetical protein
MLKIVNQGTVVSAQPKTDYSSCAFSGLCVLPNGRWLCAYRTARTKVNVGVQTTRLTWSDDEGKSWSSPIEPFKAPLIEGKEGRFRAGQPTSLGDSRVVMVLYWVDVSNPNLPFFNEETQGLLDSKIMLSFSDDNGETWSSPCLVDTSPFNQPTPITGPMLLLPDGRWILQFELNKHYYELSEWHHSSVLMFSSDGGKSWPEHTIASHDPTNRIFYWDQRPNMLSDGTIFDLFWTYDNATGIYLNNHARTLRDGEKTWSNIWDIGVSGQPAPAVQLSDGRLAMVYVDRTSEPIIKMRTSSDNGKSWPAETEMVIYRQALDSQTVRKNSMQDAWSEMGKFSLGLPTTAKTANGDIVIVFYAGHSTDETDIKFCQIRDV